ncbi:MAG: NUDIX hydrolase [Actinobacteria bacterium]|nr:NUDIX hydrolase [Actinomycetota bacterium]
MLARHSYRQGWGLPGGMLGWSEEPEVAIHREVAEELGIQVVETGPLVIRHRRRPRRMEYYFSLGLRSGVTPESVAPASPEIEEVRWFDVDDLPRLERRPGNTSEVLPMLLARRFPERFPAPTDILDR